MKKFDVPVNYQSTFITAIKNQRRLEDKLKKDFSPSLLNFGDLRIYLARHFDFCYGVENAIKVEKVWNRAKSNSEKYYSIIIHGKPGHEETRATFSKISAYAPAVIVKDLREAIELSSYIRGNGDPEKFYAQFAGQFSEGFKVDEDLQRIGVVNQTIMPASDTQEIAEYLKNTMIEKYKLDETTISERFADTRDTLCYATYENQGAVHGLLKTKADLAIVIGGYNSSNTSHLVELCERKFPTYFIRSAGDIKSNREIRHYSLQKKKEVTTLSFLPQKISASILVTSDASCPDALVEEVIFKLARFYGVSQPEFNNSFKSQS